MVWMIGHPDEFLRIPCFKAKLAAYSQILPLEIPLFFAEFVISALELNAFGLFAVMWCECMLPRHEKIGMKFVETTLEKFAST